MQEIEIVLSDEEDYGWYVFEDLSQRFWTSEDLGCNNHDVKDAILSEVRLRYGDKAVISEDEIALPYTVNHVHFDCEASMFECHATDRQSVAAMVSLINDMLKVRALKREALS